MTITRKKTISGRFVIAVMLLAFLAAALCSACGKKTDQTTAAQNPAEASEATDTAAQNPAEASDAADTAAQNPTETGSHAGPETAAGTAAQKPTETGSHARPETAAGTAAQKPTETGSHAGPETAADTAAQKPTEVSDAADSSDSTIAAAAEASDMVTAPAVTGGFDPSSIPPYSGDPYYVVNDNIPFFTEEEITDQSYEEYGPLDELDRCTYAVACVGEDLMPTEKRQPISQILPSGWHFAKYDGIDGNYLYNRCHLIAYGLTGENANERNLITGTRYMNTEGMSFFEYRTIGYIRRTGNHVMYRVTPFFNGDDLVANGVLMEALSVETRKYRFCVYVYNVQPGITINYATGESTGPLFTGSSDADHSISRGSAPEAGTETEFRKPAGDVTYVVNTNSGKFHYPYCEHVPAIKEKNRRDHTGTREELIEQGFTPCGACKP